MDVDWLIRLSGNILAYRYINRPLSLFLDHPGRISAEADGAGHRFNERIRRDEQKRCGISLPRLFAGWLWYGLRLRLFSYGWRGLFIFPQLSKLLNLFRPQKDTQ